MCVFAFDRPLAPTVSRKGQSGQLTLVSVSYVTLLCLHSLNLFCVQIGGQPLYPAEFRMVVNSLNG